MITRKERESSLWTLINSYISVLIRKLEMAIFVICKFLTPVPRLDNDNLCYSSQLVARLDDLI
jgi:hypothetical protein